LGELLEIVLVRFNSFQLTGVPLNTPIGQGAEVITNSGALEQLAKLGSNQ